MIQNLAVLCIFLISSPAFAADSPGNSNPEMASLFRADQGDRHIRPIDWSVVRPADQRRRVRTKQLLDAGALHSGEDLYEAAFVFQHGDTANDFLKAHLLAMIAVAKGYPNAPWIASATLDRYLQEIGKPQILGTQFKGMDDGHFSQEPYDRTLVSDAMDHTEETAGQLVVSGSDCAIDLEVAEHALDAVALLVRASGHDRSSRADLIGLA